MDNRQQKLLRKKKKRGKIRKEHLQKQKNKQKNDIFDQIINSPIKYGNLPDKDDRIGWARHNTITDLKKILITALKLYPNDKNLQKYLYSTKDVDSTAASYIGIKLSIAVQSIRCDPPYYIPYVYVTGGLIHTSTFELEKHHSPEGSIWTLHFAGDKENPALGNASNIVYIQRKVHQLAFSTHAIERMMDRLCYNSCTPLLLIPMSFRNIQAKVYNQSMMELYMPKFDNKTLGYVPFDVNGRFAVGNTFLVPGMKNTPEHDELERHGFTVDNYLDIYKHKDLFLHTVVAELFDELNWVVKFAPDEGGWKPRIDNTKIIDNTHCGNRTV